MELVIQFSLHEPSTLLPLIFRSSLLQVFQWWRKIIWSRVQYHVVWGAVFQRNILLVSPGDCLKMEIVWLFRTVSIPDDLVYMWKYRILVFFELKWYNEMEGGWGYYGLVVSEVWYHTPYCIAIKLCLVFNTTPVLKYCLFWKQGWQNVGK